MTKFYYTHMPTLQDVKKWADDLKATEKMPVLFLGHGNPMNVLIENEFYTNIAAEAKTIPKPTAVLCVSAHWETKGTWVTAMDKPRTIHDFGNFPQAMYEIQYPVNGSPSLAKAVKELVHTSEVHLDHEWGLDHGAWTVLKPMFPNADIPVIQLSLDYTQPASYHFDLAKQLKQLRQKGVLIVGSGNLVHNLRMTDWARLNDTYGYDWALEAQEKMRTYILNNEVDKLIHYTREGRAFQLSIPTPEHFLPLLYALAMKDENESVTIFNDKPVGGSFTMTSVKIY